MSKINNDQPVQPIKLNSIEEVFKGKLRNDKTGVIDGLLKVYGKDNDVTYLVSKVKLPKEGKDGEVKLGKEISVERDVDGHLTWKVGTKDITIGSSWWTRFNHAVKSFFSNDYKVTHEIEVTQKIEKIRQAYVACLDKESAIEVSTSKVVADKRAAEQAQAESEAQAIADEQEQVRLAQEAQVAKDAKDQRILNLNTQISTATGELYLLTEEYVDVQKQLDTAVDNKIDKETFSEEFKTFKFQSQMFKIKAELFKETNKIYINDDKTFNLIPFNDNEKNKIAEAELEFGSLATKELREKIRNQLVKEQTQLNQDSNRFYGMKSNAIQDEIDYLTGSITAINNSLNTVQGLITAKNNQIEQLRANLLAETGPVVVANVADDDSDIGEFFNLFDAPKVVVNTNVNVAVEELDDS